MQSWEGRMSKFFNKRVTLIVLAGAAIGSLVTTGVFAAIPHSKTEVISACRDDVTGLLYAIDAQSGESCASNQTSLTWGGEQSAVAFVSYNEPDGVATLAIEKGLSRNIKSSKQAVIDSLGGLGLCINVSFNLRYASSGDIYTVINPADINGGLIKSECGANYDAFIVPSGAWIPIYLSE